MPNIELDIPDTRVVVRQPSVIVDRSKLPIQSVAEFALSASYATTASYAEEVNTTWNTLLNKPSGLISGSTQITNFGFISQSINTGSFATTGSNTFVGNNTITGSLDVLVAGENRLTFNQNGLQVSNFILPTILPSVTVTGSVYFSGSFIYVYDGIQYRSASLN